MNGALHRLDRHPVMSRHPSTPMDEADLRVHLAKQTSIPAGLVDLADIGEGRAFLALDRELAGGAKIVSIDVSDSGSLREAGKLIWRRRGKRMLAVGSQGIEYALVAHWANEGYLEAARPSQAASEEELIAVVSGSCSQITANQIVKARGDGFNGIRIDASASVSDSEWDREIENAVESALAAISRGLSPIVYTALGPDDPAIAGFAEAISCAQASAATASTALGRGLGEVLKQIATQSGIRRAVIAGGDTSGHAAEALGIYAATLAVPVAPGASLCRAFSRKPGFDGFEIAFKGGQMGQPDYFSRARSGLAFGREEQET